MEYRQLLSTMWNSRIKNSIFVQLLKFVAKIVNIKQTAQHWDLFWPIWGDLLFTRFQSIFQNDMYSARFQKFYKVHVLLVWVPSERKISSNQKFAFSQKVIFNFAAHEKKPRCKLASPHIVVKTVLNATCNISAKFVAAVRKIIMYVLTWCGYFVAFLGLP